MADNEAIGLLFDVSGGGSVSGASGQIILSQIQGIVKGIQSSGATKLKFEVDTSGTKRALQQTTSKINNATNYWQGRFKDSVKDLTAQNFNLKPMNDYYKQLEKYGDDFNKKNLNAIDFEIKARDAASKAFSSQIKTKMQAEQNILNQNVSGVGVAQANGSYSKIKNTIDELDKTGKLTDDVAAQFKKAAIAKEAFNKSPTKSNLDAYKAEATAVNTLTNNLKSKERVNQQAFNNAKQFKDILAQSRKEYDKYSDSIKKHSDINERWKALNESLAKGTYSGSKIQARDELARLDKELYETGDKVETFRRKLANLFNQHLSTAAVLVGVHLIQQGIHGIYENVVELDKALVNIQIATGYTRDQTKELMSSYSQLGQEMGVATKDVASAADDWLRQGKSISDTRTLIKDSLMLSKLGEVDTATATQNLTAIQNGYKLSIEDVGKALDKLTKLDMSAAVSSSYIAQGMSETATSARLAGVSVDQLAAYIATIGETTQQSSEEVGNGLKSMFARMGNVKSGRLIDPETSESLSDVETTLTSLGIKLRDSNSEFRNTGDVLSEIMGKFNSYSSVQQRAIAVALGGTRNQERVLTLLDNQQKVLKYTSEAANSAGTAVEKYNTAFGNGIEAAQNRAKASFEALSTTIANSEIVKGVFGVGAGVLGFLNKLLSAGDGAVPKIALIVAGLALLNKAIKAISTVTLANVGRAKMIALTNMPTNDLMVTWNELVA